MAANKTPELNDDAERILFWSRVIAAVVALLPLAFFFGRRWISVRLAACRVWTQRIGIEAVADGEFVERQEERKTFLATVNGEDKDTVFVYGPRGSGKTSLIQHALQGRNGVFEIKIQTTTGNEALTEFIEEVSKQVDFFGNPQDRAFVEDVFAACRVRPIVVVDLERKCSAEVLEAVLTACKVLSYDNRKKKAAKLVVALSGSRAAVESTMDLVKLRCVGVHIGFFQKAEALKYTTDRVPTSFRDPKRRDEIAELVVNEFDLLVLDLQKVCKYLRDGKHGDVDDVKKRIEDRRKLQEANAQNGWKDFCNSLAEALKSDYDAKAVKEMALELLKGPQLNIDIVDLLSRKSGGVPLTSTHIALFNADARFHPLYIDPFSPTVSLNGKAITSVLRNLYASEDK